MRTSRPGIAALAAAVLAACAAGRPARPPAPGPHATAPGRRAFAVGAHGALEIAVPPGWTAESGGADDPSAPPTIRLERPGVAFVALLTPFFNPGEAEDEPARADAAQLFAELARRNAVAGAIEREIPLEELAGEGVHGYWFEATDRELAGREPGPEEWRHVMQGAVAVGSLVVAFSLLDNAPGPQRAEVLEMLRGARHVVRAEKGRPPGGMELDPGVRTVPLRVAVHGRSWAVLVDLPGFQMFKPRSGDDGIGSLVLGQHPASGLVASVILRAAGGAREAAACRDADLPRIREAVPKLEELRLSDAGPSARASYGVPEHGGEAVRQEHAHAWLYRDGVCANVHVSKIAPAAGDADAMVRILDSARFAEDL